MRQKYIDAINKLREDAAALESRAQVGLLEEVWQTPYGSRSGALFMPVRTGCGCLTQIKRHPALANVGEPTGLTQELVDELLNDERIPAEIDDLNLAQLEAFAEWQDRLDDLYGEDRHHL